MEKKNMVLLTVIAVATLLVAVVGATFAYFTATITDSRGEGADNGQAAIKAAETPGSLTIEKNTNGFASFNDTEVYPGHKDLIKLKITSTSESTDTYFNIIYEGTNTFPQDTIKFTLYESKEDLNGVETGNAFTCNRQSKEEPVSSGTFKLYEECNLNETLTAGTKKPLTTTSPSGAQSSSTKTVLNGNHPFVIGGDSEDKTLYYYIVVEYVNKPSDDQTAADKGKALNGNIKVEIAPSDVQAIDDSDQYLTQKAGE